MRPDLEPRTTELALATIELSKVLQPFLLGTGNPAARLVALVDLVGTIVGGCRKGEGITDEDLRDLAERFDQRITEARR